METKQYGFIPHLQVPQSKILDYPLWFFDRNNNDENSFESIRIKLKEVAGYYYDNSHLKWSNVYGHLFAINIHYVILKKLWIISVWDHTGQKALITLTQPFIHKSTDILSKENYNKLRKITEDYVKGIIECSDCRTTIKTTEIAGQYFAGNYCKNCWERKWKAVEAKENYE